MYITLILFFFILFLTFVSISGFGKLFLNLSNLNIHLVSEFKILEFARKFFEKIFTLDPNNLDSAHGYGVLLLKLNQHSKGLNYIRKGTSFIRFTPGDYKII